MQIPCSTTSGAVTFAVRVQPGARREGVSGLYGDAVRIALTAPAVDGKANGALVRHLADVLRVPRMSVEIVTGHTSRSKVVRVTGLTAAELNTRLMPTAAV